MSWSLTLLYVYILILQVWGIEDTYCRYHNLSAYPSPHIYQQINTDEYNENCLRYPSFNATLQHGVLNVEHCSSAEYRPQGSPAWMPYTAPVAITRGQTVRVRCSDGTSVMLVNPPEAKKETGFSSSNPSVFVVMVDAVSYEALHRLMPNTVDYLKGDEALDVFEFTKFSTVGLNSNPNKFATFGRHEYSKDMDKEIKLSWLWEYAKKLGYTTVIAEDQCPRHDAVWNLMNVPTQHNSVKPEEGPDYVFLDQMCVDDPHPNSYCVQGQWGYEYVADYVTGLLSTLEEQNSKQPVFMWSNFVDAHEPGQWAAALMDETVVNYLNAIVNSRFMDNGVIVFLSDHGLHFGDFAYSSVVGSAENKHPFLYTISKKGFLNQDILASNQDKLVTPYDIYQTLSSVIGYNGVVNKRDYNILSERVPSYRTCEMAGIPAPFCSCSYGPATCEPQLPYQIWETCLSRYAHPRFFDWVHYSQNELKPRYNKEFNECDSTAHWCAFGLSLGWNGTSTSGLREYVANTPELQSNEFCWTWPTDCNWGQVMNHYFNEGFIGDKDLQR